MKYNKLVLWLFCMLQALMKCVHIYIFFRGWNRFLLLHLYTVRVSSQSLKHVEIKSNGFFCSLSCLRMILFTLLCGTNNSEIWCGKKKNNTKCSTISDHLKGFIELYKVIGQKFVTNKDSESIGTCKTLKLIKSLRERINGIF